MLYPVITCLCGAQLYVFPGEHRISCGLCERSLEVPAWLTTPSQTSAQRTHDQQPSFEEALPKSGWRSFATLAAFFVTSVVAIGILGNVLGRVGSSSGPAALPPQPRGLLDQLVQDTAPTGPSKAIKAARSKTAADLWGETVLQAAATPPASRPLTGSEIAPPKGLRGLGTLHIINHTGADAAVKLADAKSRSIARFVYLRAGEDATVQRIGEGVYRVMYTHGREWEPNAMRFRRQPSFAEFEDLLYFTERQTSDGVIYEVTLHSAHGGDTRTRGIGPKDF